jgi:PIN domain nuclease of toxin-antitoxin system
LNLLLDTHTFLWFLFDDPRLGDMRAETIESTANTVFISAVSVFEVTNKNRLGKLNAAQELAHSVEVVCRDLGFSMLPLSFAHSQRAGMIQSPHRDPFDRMLAAQSIVEGIPIMTIDARIRELGAETVW